MEMPDPSRRDGDTMDACDKSGRDGSTGLVGLVHTYATLAGVSTDTELLCATPGRFVECPVGALGAIGDNGSRRWSPVLQVDDERTGAVMVPVTTRISLVTLSTLLWDRAETAEGMDASEASEEAWLRAEVGGSKDGDAPPFEWGTTDG